MASVSIAQSRAIGRRGVELPVKWSVVLGAGACPFIGDRLRAGERPAAAVDERVGAVAREGPRGLRV
jgi:hypothetical protein